MHRVVYIIIQCDSNKYELTMYVRIANVYIYIYYFFTIVKHMLFYIGDIKSDTMFL